MRARLAPLALLAWALCPAGAAAEAVDAEAQVVQAWQSWQAGDARGARDTLEQLLEARPNFRLARLLHAELLAAQAGGRAARPGSFEDPRLAELTGELQRRLEARALPADRQPAELIYLPERVHRVVAVDLSASRLYVFDREEAGSWRRVRDWYAAIGRSGIGKRDRGDLRTPVGVYRIGGAIDGDELPDLYGAGALTLDYPNAWDRAAGRGGGGIWIHGVPSDTYVRAPQSSEGCVTLANEDFVALRRAAKTGTPVILAEHLSWQTPAEGQAQRAEWLKRLEDWRLARLSADPARLSDWYLEEARSVNPRIEHELELSAIELFRYPGETGLVLAQFKAESRNGRDTQRQLLRQFWRQSQQGGWRIERELAS